ncbi:hypothetical protein GUITHDRAFT_161142 [Guillardia theta CCMP2712]|uniref:Uncharacterized protein n=2 Tax=Guillardia theta TaxID=55529 RepID=L1JXC8_GUITC|nr:hypothetical protein GUITHDRAFT_161142 [Guillardia theta CCMP2712]EKX53017.1 hypothetical protein GUITHDRAFT_161142 [Guillardia theta CCMP2712]|mmetsp:Transcript_29469/g.94514  ORF Transcript_29469/g.94514 Transcript_29469/m.94514 type:complete len:666 (+) Transcript_29469:161-2158(+)|eukprot:XP_005839997.1 hypothetical protein GUITHDRAFT_161142 [Guillardia theta CCMP2712]
MEADLERRNNQLSDLSARYSEAQRNAQKAMSLFKEAQEENDELRSNFETLKIAYQALQDKLNEEKYEHESTRIELSKMVKERDMQHAQWKAELDIKAKQFEELRSQIIPPRELDEIRMRMAEELETPIRQRADMLEEELEKQRESYFQLRRQLEKLKFEKDQMQAEHEQDMLEATEKHRAIEAELNIRISGLQAALDDTTEVQEINVLQREVQSLKVKEKKLLGEIADLRSEKEALRVAKEVAGQEVKDKMDQMATESSKKDFMMDDLRRKISHLERELEQETEGHKRTEAKLLEWERENSVLQRKLDEMDFSMKSMQRSLLREIEEERSSWSKERQQLKMTISKAESMQAELQVNMRASQDYADENVQKKISALREENMKKIAKMEEQMRRESEKREAEVENWKNREEDLQNRLNEAESSRNKLIFEIENNSKQAKQVESDLNEMLQMKRVLEKEKEELTCKLDEVVKQKQSAEESLTKVTRDYEIIKDENRIFEDANNRLKREIEKSQQSFEKEQAETEKKLKKMEEETKSIIATYEDSERKMREQLTDLKKKAKKFRGLASKFKEKFRSKFAVAVQQLQAQEAMISRLRQEAQETEDKGQKEVIEITRKLFEVQKEKERLLLLYQDQTALQAELGETFQSQPAVPSSPGGKKQLAALPKSLS